MADQELAKSSGSALGLASSGRGFFSGGDRRTHLEQLRHLSQWSRRVLVVTGPRGIGKSTLYRQLSSTLEPRTKAARINGALVNSAREVLNAMVQGFGLASPADGDLHALSDLIASHAREQERAERLCVTLVDDAELLEPRALDAVVRIAARAPLRVVLFGESRLVPVVQRAAGARSVGWHELRLNGFDVVEARDYLDWRFRQQGHTEGLPFTDAQVVEIVRLAEGLPGRIDQVANMLLTRMHARGRDDRRRTLPALHQALLAVLVVGIAFAWLVWPTADDDTRPGASSVERLEILPLATREVDQDLEEATVEVAGQAGEIAGPIRDAAVPTRDIAPHPAEVEAPARTIASPVTGSRPQDVTAGEGASEPAPKAQPDAARPQAARDAPRDQDPATRGIAESNGPRDAVWIMSRPPFAYTLQLASFSTEERASRYLAAQSEGGSFARFRQQRNGKILHVVIYGEFGTRVAAEEAAARLPSSAGTVQPWVRSFREVQDAVRTALQP